MGQILGFHISPVPRTLKKTDAVLCIQVQGGNIYLRRSTLEDAGGNWEKLMETARDQAHRHGIPLQDDTAI